MCIKPKGMSNFVPPNVYLINNVSNYVCSQKYLGSVLCDNMEAIDDIKNCLHGICTRGNSIIRNIIHCSEDVKCLLFKTYCNNNNFI